MGLIEWFRGGGEEKTSPPPKDAKGKPKEELKLTLAEERLISFFRKRDYAGILNLISHFKPAAKQDSVSKDIKNNPNPTNKHTVSREKIIILELMLERLSSIAQKAKTLKDIAEDLNKIGVTLKEINDTK